MEANYFDHEADIGIIGRGASIEECFVSAAFSMCALMSDLTKIEPKQSVHIEFKEADVELALVIWLNLLLAKAREEGVIFSKFELEHKNDQWKGQAWGEPWQEEFERGIEVKGATLTMLSVTKIDHTWEARCIVDV